MFEFPDLVGMLELGPVRVRALVLMGCVCVCVCVHAQSSTASDFVEGSIFWVDGSDY